jgi:hypothetical protein
MGGGFEDLGECFSKGRRPSSNKEGVEVVDEPDDDTCPTSTDSRAWG